MRLIARLLINGFAVFVTSYFLPGVSVNTFFTAIVVATGLGIINSFVQPIIVFFTLPLTILSFGLFSFVINGFLVYLISHLIAGFTIKNFWWALFFSLTISLVNSFLYSLSR